ncbi:hypothetical protein RA28_08815 [Ruegeria sp. ANG-S4]|uniref:hypothetical protein n=1 Tax=Ruegeria sp. ANG-S4 TaxID=1577904 RepID=UPI00057F17CE|nr:hypothetical protein [Ruegeria sp. ANG-S4]KIC45780.1 hypothetical protein RA28_08815 [Ruegeria sp. ANG-S4]
MTKRRQITRLERSELQSRQHNSVGFRLGLVPGVAVIFAVFLVGALVGLLFMAAFVFLALLLVAGGLAVLVSRRWFVRNPALHLRRRKDE